MYSEQMTIPLPAAMNRRRSCVSWRRTRRGLAITLAAGALQVFVVVRRCKLPKTPARRGDRL